jgi:hypothetical protein
MRPETRGEGLGGSAARRFGGSTARRLDGSTAASERVNPRPASRALRLASVLLLAALPAVVHAQSRLTQQEALSLAFPGRDSVIRQTAFLSIAEVAKVATLSGPGVEPPASVVSYYVAWRQGHPVGVAYFDTHRVRTEREVLMFVLDSTGATQRVEVLAFGEPPEYAPPPGWLDQFRGSGAAAGSSRKGKVVGITGATLTTRAAERAARRVAALHAVIHPFGPAGAP